MALNLVIFMYISYLLARFISYLQWKTTDEWHMLCVSLRLLFCVGCCTWMVE